MKIPSQEKLSKSNTGPSKGNKILALLRIGCPVLAASVIIVTYVLQNFPISLPLAIIKTGHLDVSLGLYTSLRSSLTDAVLSSNSNNHLLPIDSGLSDSEITILSNYAQTQVANAPQEIILGFYEWCSFSYATNFSDHTKMSDDVITTCHKYHSKSIYDYRDLLSENQLDIILAYAYKDSAVNDSAYQGRVNSRQHRLDVMIVIYAILLAQQIVLCGVSVALYSSTGVIRGVIIKCLNLIGVLALVSGVTMLVAIVTVARDLVSTSNEIKIELADFGVLMVASRNFFALAIVELSSGCIGMLAWVIPLWCSNPSQDKGDLNEELIPNEHRETHFRAHSRLFDHVEESLDSSVATFSYTHDSLKGSSSPNEVIKGKATP